MMGSQHFPFFLKKVSRVLCRRELIARNWQLVSSLDMSNTC
jgi:hypothetical protein